MLNEFRVPYFHASALENRERDDESRYRDWSREEVVRFFTRALDVVCDTERSCAWMAPIGCSVSLKNHSRGTQTQRGNCSLCVC